MNSVLDMTSAFGIAGELRVYGLSGPRPLRPYTPPELEIALERGHARLLTKTKNLLTDIGLDALAGLFGGALGIPIVGGDAFGPANLPDLAVRSMEVTAEITPTAPAATDVALEGVTLFSADITGGTLFVTYPAAGQVRFSAVLSQLEQAGTTFTEEGLFNGEGDLLARTTFSRAHVNTLNLQFDHTFQMARA